MSKGIDTRLLSMIQLTLADGRQVSIRATIGRPRTVSRQAAELNAAIRDRT
ncbi:MAG: hypothetical protein QM598_02080 [Protaetiibacter sp.]